MRRNKVKGVARPEGKGLFCQRVICRSVALALAFSSFPAQAATYDMAYAGFSLRSSAMSAARMAAAVLASESVDDVDGFPLPPQILTGFGGPTGGGLIPASSNAPKVDGTSVSLGYCAWDNGSSTVAVGRIAGTNSLSVPALAVIAPGINGTYNTTCADVLAGIAAPGNGAKGDDIVVAYTTAQLRSLYSLHVGQAVADMTALNSIAASSLRDGEIRLVKSDNSIKRWDSVASSWKSAGGGGFAPDVAGNLKAGANAFVTTAVGTGPAATDGPIQNLMLGTDAGRYLYGVGFLSEYAQHNVGLGYQAIKGDSLSLASRPLYNVAIGYQSMGSVNNMPNNGRYNVAIGHMAMASGYLPLSAYDNVAIGNGALSKVGNGSQNVAIGLSALSGTVSESDNIALGAHALVNYDGASRIAIGYMAGQSASGDYSIALGIESLKKATGVHNVALGYLAGNDVIGGTYNTLLGAKANVSSAAINYGTALGAGAVVNTSNTVVLGRASDTTVIGATGAAAVAAQTQLYGGLYLAPRVQPAANLVPGLLNFNSADNTLYYYNGSAWVAAGGGGGGSWSPDVNENLRAGVGALVGATTGKWNVAIGSGALSGNTTGSDHIAIGQNAQLKMNGGYPNIALGKGALYGFAGSAATNTGGRNVAIGNNAMYGSSAAITGYRNIAVGDFSLTRMATGSDNIALGYEAMNYSSAIGRSIAIGTQAMRYLDPAAPPLDGPNIAIGYGAMSEGYGIDMTSSNTASSNIAIGFNALKGDYLVRPDLSIYPLTATNTIAIGKKAMEGAFGGDSNIALGLESMQYIKDGSDNIALGARSLRNNIDGNRNVGLGQNALVENRDGNDNVAIGRLAGVTANAANGLVSGSFNTFLGSGSGFGSPTQLNYASAIGAGSLVTSNNTIVLGRATDRTVIGATGDAGYDAALQVTGGLYLAPRPNPVANVAAGLLNFNSVDSKLYYHNGTKWVMTGALMSDESGNLAAGDLALGSGTPGSDNIALGYSALAATTAYENIAIGTYAMANNVDGYGNVAMGISAMEYSNSAYDNVTIGYGAGQGIMGENVNFLQGGGNVAVGKLAMSGSPWDSIYSTGSMNVAVGELAMSVGSTADGNVAIGATAMRGASTTPVSGPDNTAIGTSALFYLESGVGNTALGARAGMTDNTLNVLVTGSYNTFLGYEAGYGSSAQLDFATAIGAGAKVTTSDTVVLGRPTDITVIGHTAADTTNAGYGRLQVGGAITPTDDNTYDLGSSLKRWASVYAGNGTIQTSDMRLKTNISSISGDEAVKMIRLMNPVRYNWSNPKDGAARKVGFLAQELAQILPEVVHIPNSQSDYYGINYAEITSLLTAAVKKQQEVIGLFNVKPDTGKGVVLAINGMLEADVIEANRLKAKEADIDKLRAKEIDADKIRTSKVTSGETVVTTGSGCAPLFSMQQGAVYEVRALSAMGGWGSMRIGLSATGPVVQDRKISDGASGVELNIIGDQVCAISAMSQSVNASWLRVL